MGWADSMSSMGKMMINFHKFLFIVSIACFGLNGCEEQPCLEDVQENFVMTDELAISLSKKAMQKIGVDVSNMEPEPYSDNSNKLFSRNTINKNNGYILWHQKNIDTSSGYSVSIVKKGPKIYCDAGKNL